MSVIKNSNIKKSLLFLAFFSFLFSIESCKSTKIPSIEPAQPAKDTLSTSRRQTKVDTVFNNMKMNEIRFDWMQSKFSAVYEKDGEKTSFGGQIRIRRDSAIWVSISPGLGIEVFRVLITQDSIKMLNKMQKTYFAAKINYINKLLNTDLDYDMLQALLTNSDFPYYETNVFEVMNLGNDFILSTINRRKLKKIVAAKEEYEKVLVQNIRIEKESFKILKQSVKQVKDPNKKLEIEYKNFQAIGNQLFPLLLDVKMEDLKTIELNIEYTKITFDEEQSFPMKVPENYTRVVVPE